MGVLDVGMCRYASEQCPAKGEHVALQFNVKMGNCEYSVKAFGIFDAHFGPLAAQFVKNNLQEALSQLLQHHNSERLTDRGVRNALKLVFVELNRRFLIENCNLKNEATGEYVANQGATAIMTMILDKKVWTAGMGGVAILFREGNALCLNREAKPGSDAFAKGVAKRGGTIQNGLVEGEVSTTRGIGFAYLNGVISSRPKVTVNISGGDLLLLSTEFSKRCSLQELVPVLNATKGISARELAANLVYSVHPPAEASTHVIVVRGDEEESYVPVDPPPPSPTQAQQQYYDGAKPEELQRHFPPASPRASFPDVVSVGDEKSVRGDAVGEAAAPAGRGSPVLSDSYVRLTEKELRGNSEDSEEY
ncbi:MAG TPA: PP2C family serine/threonine-protein phosphatase [Chlamydiales bacterium]|nr:PP2C family serine/threonine-protein phosphatase [Chlamydiales bacterium]